MTFMTQCNESLSISIFIIIRRRTFTAVSFKVVNIKSSFSEFFFLFAILTSVLITIPHNFAYFSARVAYFFYASVKYFFTN